MLPCAVLNRRLAVATSARFPDLSEDDRLFVRILEGEGWEVVPVIWDSNAAEPSGLAAILIRSCWDYHLSPGRFRAWLERIESSGVPIFNAPSLMRWNIDKRYLGDLEACGVTIIPTAFADRRSESSLEQILASRAWGEAIVKPAVSAGAHETMRIAASEARAQEAEYRRLLDRVSEEGVLIQPYVPEIEERGELSFLFFGGAFSHAVLKTPRPGDFRVQAHLGGSTKLIAPSPRSISRARSIIEAATGCARSPIPLYARVDAVEREGELHLMELEVIEPFLFFEYDGGAAARFAECLTRALEV
jgi:glutathione synthase/RimK-type ligase-like ATP-grasp enzyme